MCLLLNVTSFCIPGADAELVQQGRGWTQLRKERTDKHRVKLLAATQQLFEKLEVLSSYPASSASPVLGNDANAEQDIPVILDVQETPESPAVHHHHHHSSLLK
jgi:hypothetical protein